MEQNMNFFYVFINIKGALYTADWIKFNQCALQEDQDITSKAELDTILKKHPDWNRFYQAKVFTRSKHIRKICPDNVESLNRLIDDLKLDYNVNLIVTSDKWKDAFDIKAIPALVKNGLNYKDLVIDKTSNKAKSTTDGIKNYLEQVGNPQNYLIIDYTEEIAKNFDQNKVIIVDQYATGLNNELVDNYLDSVEEMNYVENNNLEYDNEISYVVE